MIGDFLRFWWHSLYWNARKSRYVWSGRRGPAPCQHPSDSGRAGKTACVACQEWRRAARFRRVCPLLVQVDGEWRCSVDAAQVRPFWGRVIVAGLGALLAGWLVVSLAAFATLSAVGYRELHYADFWRPDFRTRYREAKGAYYSEVAHRALAANEFPRGIVALSIAYASGPRRWEDGLLLAQLLARTRQFPAADQTFRSLIDGFPERAEEIATLWGDALLLRGDTEKLIALARDRFAAGTPVPAPWWRLIVKAVRMEEEPARKERGLARLEALPFPRARPLAAIERRIASGAITEVVKEMGAGGAAVDAGEVQYRCETLSELAAFPAAEEARRAGAAMLGEFHARLLGVRLAAAQGREALADLGFENLLTGELHSAKLDLLLAELVRHPSAARLQVLESRWPSRATRADLETARALVRVACGVETPKLSTSKQSRPTVGDEIVNELGRSLRSGSASLPRPNRRALLSALALPREVTLAVLEPGSAPTRAAAPASP